MARESLISEEWKQSMRLAGRGLLIALAGFAISVVGTLPWLGLLIVVGYVVTMAGVIVGFVGLWAPTGSSVFRFVWEKAFRKPYSASE